MKRGGRVFAAGFVSCAMRYPFTLIICDASRLLRYLSQWDVAEAFSRMRLVEPEGVDDEFPRAWRWNDAVCALFSRPQRWRLESLRANLESLCREAKMMDRHIIFHLEFESDLRRLGLPVRPEYVMQL